VADPETNVRLVVGAVVIDPSGRAFVQKRSDTERIFPGSWDCINGHVEPGETMEEALAREIHEETGWTLRRIVAQVGEWTWEAGGEPHREVDFLVEVDGDLGTPQLERQTHTECRWVGGEDLADLLDDGDPGNHLTHQALTEAFALARRLHWPGSPV
jgi:8-oxo-dGTP pyrophosphatase MutT (NUDIX family)